MAYKLFYAQGSAAMGTRVILEEIGENSVRFTAVSEGGMAKLGYSHPDADTFIIHVGQPDGSEIEIPLQARSIWEQ